MESIESDNDLFFKLRQAVRSLDQYGPVPSDVSILWEYLGIEAGIDLKSGNKRIIEFISSKNMHVTFCHEESKLLLIKGTIEDVKNEYLYLIRNKALKINLNILSA